MSPLIVVLLLVTLIAGIFTGILIYSRISGDIAHYNHLTSQQAPGSEKDLNSSSSSKAKNESGQKHENVTSIQDSATERKTIRESENKKRVYEALKNIGCNPQWNEDDNIGVSYQGENFLIQFNGAFIRIWDLSWLATKNTDDNYTLLKDAVNYANFSFGPVILMHAPDEDGKIIISSRLDILFSPHEDDNEGYISAMLDSFFAIKSTLQSEIGRLRNNPSDRTLMDISIGIDTASLADPSSPQAN